MSYNMEKNQKKVLITGVTVQDDTANWKEACLYLTQNYLHNRPINIGTGTDLSIQELENLLQRITNYTGQIVWNTNKPDGTPCKLLDVQKNHDLGWIHQIGLEATIRSVYQTKFSKD